MSTDRHRRSPDNQPELPFHPPRTGASSVPTASATTQSVRRPTPTGDWRLDERTRRIGRQGVAAARAQLEAASSADPQKRADGDRRPAGRAA